MPRYALNPLLTDQGVTEVTVDSGRTYRAGDTVNLEGSEYALDTAAMVTLATGERVQVLVDLDADYGAQDTDEPAGFPD